MYKKIALLCLLFGALMLHAENKNLPYQIAGQAVEASNGKNIPYATVTLQNDSAKVLKKISSDVNGKFSFAVKEKSKYTVVLSFMGFKDAKVVANVTEAKTDVGKVAMEEGVVMKEVSIVAQKPLVKVEPDKLTYSVESDPDAKTSSALEILRKIPLVTVDGEDNVTVNGKSNFKVLVNGKSSSMMSNNFKEVIKSIPANTIKNIEVITNPSSKYEAEGVGGIINIITTKKNDNGYNGNVSTGIDSRGSWNGSLYLATKISKFSASVRVSASQFKQPENATTTNKTNFISDIYHTTNTSSVSKYNGIWNNYSGELSYEIDSLNLISSSFWGYGGNNKRNASAFTRTFNSNNALSQSFENQTNGKSNYGGISGNIDYQRTYKKPDKTFTISYKLDNSPNTSHYETSIFNCSNYSPYTQNSSNDAYTREQTLQVDYYDPLSAMHQLECGIKGIYRENRSNTDTYLLDETTDAWIRNASKSNCLDYDQYILGGYAGYVFKLKKFTAKGGLRTEFTWNNATSTSDTVVSFTNRLKNFVPYINLMYQIKPESSIKLSYTQRLSRPGIWFLNPYVDNTDPMNISHGNPNLKSEISHSFELAYSFFMPKFNFNLSLSSAFTNNSIKNITTINSQGVTNTTYKNIGSDFNTGLNLYASYHPCEKVNITLNGSSYYSKLQANNGYSISSSGTSYYGSLNTRFVFWKDGSINMYGGIYSPSIELQNKSSMFYYSSIGLSQSFLSKKLMLSMSLSNPFWKIRTFSNTYTDPNYYMHTNDSYRSRTLRFSVTYNFGKMGLEVKKAKRGIQNDDVKSGGSSSGGGGN